jgi:hypothetical protein
MSRTVCLLICRPAEVLMTQSPPLLMSGSIDYNPYSAKNLSRVFATSAS